MKTVLSFMLLAIVLLPLQLLCQAPAWAWAHSAGSGTMDLCGGRDYHSNTIATDRMGNSYITGLFNGTATFGNITMSSPSSSKGFVAKYDPNGTCLWVKQFGGAHPDIDGNEGRSVDVDDFGNCYVAGTFIGPLNSTIPFGASTLTCTGGRQIVIAKYDANGNEQWAVQPGGSSIVSNYANGIAADANGNTYVTGTINQGSFGNIALPGYGGFALKLDPFGTIVWAIRLSNTGRTYPICIDADLNGNSVISGYVQGSDTYTTPAPTLFTCVGDRDIFLMKVDPTGTLSWVKQLNGVDDPALSRSKAQGRGISTDGAGNIYLTGDFSMGITIGNTTYTANNASTSACFAAKFDPNGTSQWAFASSVRFPFSSTLIAGTAIKATPGGNCYVTGYYSPPTLDTLRFGGITFPDAGNYVTYALKINSNGAVAWSQFSQGNHSDAQSSGISLDGGENAYISGNVLISSAFGSNSISSQNNSIDIFIAKLGNASLPTSIESTAKDASINIYPNPFSDATSIHIIGYNGKGTLSLSIYNPLGQEVKRIDNIGNTITLQREFMPAGVYLYELSDKNKLLKTGKLVVE